MSIRSILCSALAAVGLVAGAAVLATSTRPAPAYAQLTPEPVECACSRGTNLASAGVKGGALIVIGEDYGEGASIIQERSHAFAMKSQIWLLDPRPNLTRIVEMVEHGFALSEASSTPVMLELRIRACHVQGTFRTRRNRAARFSRRAFLENPDFDFGRISLPPLTTAEMAVITCSGVAAMPWP